jgi:hypothetical protein
MKRAGNLAKKTLVFILFVFLTAGAAQGATFTVTKTAGTNDGMCDADYSLRAAIAQVNANTAGGVTHRIEFSTLFNFPSTFAGASQSVVAVSDSLSDVDFTALEITSFGKPPDD